MLNLFMYDDVNVKLIPKNVQAVAGYVDGHYITWHAVLSNFPNAKHLSIAVSARTDAMCLDIERGDATNGEAAAWVKRQIKRGVHRPVVYTSLSNAQTLVRDLKAAGVSRQEFRLWTAHYNDRQHLCGPACDYGLMSTADATQFTDRANRESLDESLCAGNFFDAPAPAPKPVPVPAPKPGPPPQPVPVPKPKPAPKPKPKVKPLSRARVLQMLAEIGGWCRRAAVKKRK